MYKIFPITVCVIASLMLAVDKVIAEPTLLIFGSEGNGKRGHTVFLGCISCGEYDRNSLRNDLGKYGNSLSPTSIYNDLGKYGSSLSTTSACNSLASNPPVVVDTEGNFYGYLTLNDLIGQKIIDPRRLGACRENKY